MMLCLLLVLDFLCVEMAVPPTMVVGELSVEISEGETSGEDYSDSDYSDIDD